MISSVTNISNKSFGISKASVEDGNAECASDIRGGWIGLTHLNVQTHFNRFNHILRRGSPFVAVECDNKIFSKLEKDAHSIDDKRIRCVHGNIFDILSMFPRSRYHQDNHKWGKLRTPLLSYFHIDFCRTIFWAMDNGFIELLRDISQWWNVKRKIVLDISFSTRGDKGNRGVNTLLNHLIPITMQQSNWKINLVLPRHYHDTIGMYNIYVELEKLSK